MNFDQYQTISFTRRKRVLYVTFNRPERLNAVDELMHEELAQVFVDCSRDPDSDLVVVTGAGRAFCAGLDLKESSAAGSRGEPRGPVAGLMSQRRISEIVMRMRRAPQPIISLVHGPACGGGFAIALASDVRIAGQSARMNAAFIRIGLSACDIGVSYFLPRLVGVSVASELMLTGRFIQAERALRVGLVSEVVADDALAAAAQPYIDEMLATSPIGLRLTKECLNMSVDAGSLEAAVAMEDRNQILASQSDDFREGISAFLEKRPPSYHNR